MWNFLKPHREQPAQRLTAGAIGDTYARILNERCTSVISHYFNNFEQLYEEGVFLRKKEKTHHAVVEHAVLQRGVVVVLAVQVLADHLDVRLLPHLLGGLHPKADVASGRGDTGLSANRGTPTPPPPPPPHPPPSRSPPPPAPAEPPQPLSHLLGDVALSELLLHHGGGGGAAPRAGGRHGARHGARHRAPSTAPRRAGRAAS